MPEVTKFAFYIQKYANLTKQTALEVDLVECEFIFGQLLIISKFLDYGDEVGRRRMFALLRKYFTSFFSYLRIFKQSLIISRIF